MGGHKLLLDTSAVVAFFKGDPDIRALIAISGGVFVPVTVIGELLCGALRSARVVENVGQVEAFAADNHVLDCDIETARQSGEIYSELSAAGRRIPENDIWIAAVARQHGLPLAARDGHFDRVPMLLGVPC